MTPVLALQAVSKMRGAGRHAVRALTDVTLELRASEVLLLRGPSGSGKTTLLCVAGGLLTPDRGEVRLAGERLPVARAHARTVRARRIGFVFQRSNLISGLSAFENVVLAGALAGMTREGAACEARRLLEALGVGHLGARPPAELSTGEEQRVAVARALVHRPSVILADEPTANLDRASGRDVAMLLASIARASSIGVVVATHDDRLAEIGTREVSLSDGRLQ